VGSVFAMAVWDELRQALGHLARVSGQVAGIHELEKRSARIRV